MGHNCLNYTKVRESSHVLEGAKLSKTPPQAALDSFLRPFTQGLHLIHNVAPDSAEVPTPAEVPGHSHLYLNVY